MKGILMKMNSRRILVSSAISAGLLLPWMFQTSLEAHEDSRSSQSEHQAPNFLVNAVTSKELSQLVLRGDYRVTAPYQPVRVHAGIDFGGIQKDKTSVYSPVSGTVIENTDKCGKVAIFDNKNTIILAHMSARTTLKKGDPITAGTYVGKTSDVVGGDCVVLGGAHLHLEIRRGEDATMSRAENDNTGRNLDPLTYPFDQSPPSIKITSPSKAGTSFSTGREYTLSWSATDPSGLGDVSVELISSRATTCSGAPTPLYTVRMAGAGYVDSVKWKVPTSTNRGSYNLKVAARDKLNNWGCVMTPISVK